MKVVTIPESVEGLIYFSKRKVKGCDVMAWVHKKNCPKCGKAKMGKPVVKGKVKIRATEYVCPECEYTVEKKEYEESLMCEAKYTCPECKKEGTGEVLFKRKKIKIINDSGQEKKADAVVFTCEHCDNKIPVTKKMK